MCVRASYGVGVQVWACKRCECVVWEWGTLRGLEDMDACVYAYVIVWAQVCVHRDVVRGE